MRSCNDAHMTTGPAQRRGAIDVARVVALLVVVLGHLSLAVIDRGPDGALRGANLIALHPGWLWVTALSPMPVFFAAGGWANSTSTLGHAARRLRTIVGLATFVVTLWSVASIVELLVRGDGGIVADGARIATQPLWFLAAYVPFASFGSTLTRAARRPLASVGACLVALAVLDVARFGFGAPRWVAWPGFFAAWGVPWLLGAWWRTRADGWHPRTEQLVGLTFAVGGTIACAALVRWARYTPALIDAVPGRRSNTTPPTLFTAVAGVAQVGALLCAAQVLDRVAARHRRVVDRGAAAAVGVYVWHLTALSLCAALLAAGMWAPTRLSTAWWCTRPAWFALVLGVTALFTLGTARLVARSGPGDISRRRSIAGLLATTVGAAVVGVSGPRHLPGATTGIVAFVAGWLLLAPHPRRTTSSAPAHGSAPDRSR